MCSTALNFKNNVFSNITNLILKLQSLQYRIISILIKNVKIIDILKKLSCNAK